MEKTTPNQEVCRFYVHLPTSIPDAAKQGKSFTSTETNVLHFQVKGKLMSWWKTEPS
jgi:hypothetical protein